MSKWKQHRAPEVPQQAPQPSAPTLPPGRWLRVERTTESGVYGYVLDELTQNEDGSFSVRRIHGPDLPAIVGFVLERETIRAR